MYNLKIQKNEYITGKHWHDLSPVCTTVTPLIESAYNWIVVSDTAPGTATEPTDENAENTEAGKTVSVLSYSIPDIQM